MSKVRHALVALLLVLAAPQAQAQESETAKADVLPVIRNAIDEFILPGYRSFRWSTEWLGAGLARLCAEPSGHDLMEVRYRFEDVAKAWARIELVRFGPVTERNRLERILYWPDRRGIGLRQVQAILADKDPTAVDLGTLVDKSVAVQGLGALEFVLFGTGSDALSTGDDYRCRYARTIVSNLRQRAIDIEEEWQQADTGMEWVWTKPGADNPLYRDEKEALSELVDIFVHGLEMVRDVRIGGFLGETPEDDKPRQALYWRSRNTMGAIRTNLQSLSALFEESGIATLLPPDRQWLAQSIAFEFENAEDALVFLDSDPIAEILASERDRGKVDYARLVSSSLSDLFGRQLSAEFGLTAGFSSLDGD